MEMGRSFEVAHILWQLVAGGARSSYCRTGGPCRAGSPGGSLQRVDIPPAMTWYIDRDHPGFEG